MKENYNVGIIGATGMVGQRFIMLLHNHPGGNPTPSENDLRITERVREVGQMVDIPLFDHIIIGDNSYFSFQESHLMM